MKCKSLLLSVRSRSKFMLSGVFAMLLLAGSEVLVDVEDVVGKISMGSKYWVLAVGRTVSDLLVRV